MPLAFITRTLTHSSLHRTADETKALASRADLPCAGDRWQGASMRTACAVLVGLVMSGCGGMPSEISECREVADGQVTVDAHAPADSARSEIVIERDAGIGDTAAVATDSAAPADPCDQDSDGYRAKNAACRGTDCNDHDPHAFPGAPPKCNGLDNDCSGSIDFSPSGEHFYIWNELANDCVSRAGFNTARFANIRCVIIPHKAQSETSVYALCVGDDTPAAAGCYEFPDTSQKACNATCWQVPQDSQYLCNTYPQFAYPTP